MKRFAVPILFLIAIATLVVTPFIGAEKIPFSAIFAPPTEGMATILWSLRIPRVLLGLISGAILSICGMIYQALFRNPLATPDMLGVSAGAAFGAVLYTRIGLEFILFGILPGLSIFAFFGALAATATIYITGSVKRGGLSEVSLLLAGIAISFLFSSMNMVIQYGGNFTDSFRILHWSIGGLDTVGFAPVWMTLPAFVLIFVLTTMLSPELDLLVCGEYIASSRGVSVTRLRGIFFIAVSLVVAVDVSVCGPIGFIGLLAPHICRKIIGEEHRRLTFASALFGGSFLVICDTASRVLWSPAEVPVGILTSFVGSLFFIWLLLKKG